MPVNEPPVDDSDLQDMAVFDDHDGPFAGLVIAIDGPAGSGKSTVAQRVADALGLPHVDTGALYRTAALACLRQGVDLDDGRACGRVVASSSISRDGGRTYLDGEDVEEEIRGPVVTAAVSKVAAHPQVRDALGPAQRAAVKDSGGVVEGRDIGTVVLPDADLKVFLTATAEERASRRARQLGRDDVEALTAEIRARDRFDGERSVAPMQRADDAWELDTTQLEIDEVVAAIVDRLIETRFGESFVDDDPVVARRRLPRVVIVGRPNVGKSTLVNRILGARVAIVEEKPGVTRDRTEHDAEWLGRPFIVVDTGGWEHQATGMSAQVVEQAQRAIAEADVVVFVVDATVGALEDDERYARQLRRGGVPTILAANKIDGARQEVLVHELYPLGLGTPHPISARHGRGIGDLLDVITEALPPTIVEAPDTSAVPRVAIVGKPNVGKSSLFNRLVGEDRSIVDAVPHTTRDAVDTLIEIDGCAWQFVDTAGMRRRYRRGEDTELYSVDRTRQAVDEADLVVFMIDASQPLGEQDQRLAALLRDAGRGLVLVCNKWDLVDDERRYDLERELDRMLGFASWAPRVNLSATSGRGVRRLIPQLVTVWENYSRRISTQQLNRVIGDATSRHAPPRHNNRQIRIRYATQPQVRPPRIVLFSNGPIPASYLRYLEGVIRDHASFEGVPIVIEDRARSGTSRRRSRRHEPDRGKR